MELNCEIAPIFKSAPGRMTFMCRAILKVVVPSPLKEPARQSGASVRASMLRRLLHRLRPLCLASISIMIIIACISPSLS